MRQSAPSQPIRRIRGMAQVKEVRSALSVRARNFAPVNLHETAIRTPPPSTRVRFTRGGAFGSLPKMNANEDVRLSLRRNVRELPRTAWILILGSFINRFASFAVFYLVLYLTRRGFSPAAAGLAVATWGVGEVLASLVGGHLADRIGRRTTIAMSMFWSAAAVVAISQISAYAAILPVAFVAGLASEMFRPAGGALIADAVPEAQRVTAFALLRFAVNLGIAAGAAVAGFLASHSYTGCSSSDAATSVAFGMVALVALPEQPRPGVREGDERREGYRDAFADGPSLVFLAASVLAAFVYFQQQAALPLHVTGERPARTRLRLAARPERPVDRSVRAARSPRGPCAGPPVDDRRRVPPGRDRVRR